MSSRMEMYCPICRSPMNGMRAYGRWHCCDKECHDEAEWRNVLAIMNRPYEPRSVTTNQDAEGGGA